MTLYREAKKEDLERVTELLTDCFKADPFSKFLVEDCREKDLDFYMQYTNTQTYFKKHKCFVGVDGDKVVSVVLLKEKGKRESGFFDFILSGGLKVIFKSGIRYTLKILNVLEEAKEKCQLHQNNEWYLDEIAVDKSCQGCNLGSEMIQKCIVPYISKCGGGSLFLITNTEINRKFYRKNGFKEFDERIIMRRDKSISNWSFKMEI